MKDLDTVKKLSLIVRATGIIFWYNFLGEMFFNESIKMKILRVVVMVISLVLGYLSNKEKNNFKDL